MACDRGHRAAAADVSLTDPTTGAVHGEIEGLAPGTVRPLRETLGNGSYAFERLPDDTDASPAPPCGSQAARYGAGLPPSR
ncbi:hypothetical protein [Streptomyces sp. NBC_01530]|uniref:hypothetical protein n=1 Tax=Streptomyces sp. NBC_01530 TaxID=2903895 RepID=UPI003869DBC9